MRRLALVSPELIRVRAALTSGNALTARSELVVPACLNVEIRFAIEKIRYSRSDTTLRDR